MSALAASAWRSWARKVPVAVSLVHALRRGRDWTAARLARTMERRFASMYWRLHRFDAMSGPYALGCHPEESYLVASSDRVIGKKLYARGTFDLQKLMRAFEILRAEQPGAVPGILADVGANIGSICIPAVRRKLVKRALAFEPDPGNFRLLRINVLLNGVEDGIECHEVALGESDGTATLSLNPENHGDHRIVAGGPAGAGTREVPVRTLDSFLDGLPEPCLLWLDVQGLEPEVLAGASRAIAAGWPVVMEFTPGDLDARGTLRRLSGLIADSPYTRYFDLDGDAMEEFPVAQLDRLGAELLARGTFTDLLLMPDRDRTP
jgi:FkbM family methyltransferase